MTSHRSNPIEIGNITTIDNVLKELKILDENLTGYGLDQFKLFNKAYFIVTNNVQQAGEQKYFKNPKFIEKFIVTFASYYFEAVNDTCSKNASLTLPWSKLNEYAKNKSAPKFISLMLGANAHINNDLPQVLKILMQQEDTEELLGDIVKIDKLLMKSGREIIGSFEESNKFLDFLKRRLQFTYYRPAMYTILYWRIIAWKNYRRLTKDGGSISLITKRSVKIADRLLRISNVLA